MVSFDRSGHVCGTTFASVYGVLIKRGVLIYLVGAVHIYSVLQFQLKGGVKDDIVNVLLELARRY